MSWPGLESVHIWINNAAIEISYKEGDEDGGVHHDQGNHGGQAVSELVDDRAGEEDTDKGTALAGLEEGGLPLRLDGLAAASNFNTVSVLESLLGNKVTVQEHVERFHNLFVEYPN